MHKLIQHSLKERFAVFSPTAGTGAGDHFPLGAKTEGVFSALVRLCRDISGGYGVPIYLLRALLISD